MTTDPYVNILEFHHKGKSRPYASFVLPKIKWWEKTLLFFIPPIGVCDYGPKMICKIYYKKLFGHIYIVNEEIKENDLYPKENK